MPLKGSRDQGWLQNFDIDWTDEPYPGDVSQLLLTQDDLTDTSSDEEPEQDQFNSSEEDSIESDMH